MLIAPIVAKKNSKWSVGFIDGKKFIEKKVIKRLRDIKNESDYKSLSSYLKLNKIEESEKSILKKFRMDKIYILDNAIDLDNKELQKWLWVDINKKCKKCIKECKQSHKVILVSCKGYKRI